MGKESKTLQKSSPWQMSYYRGARGFHLCIPGPYNRFFPTRWINSPFLQNPTWPQGGTFGTKALSPALGEDVPAHGRAGTGWALIVPPHPNRSMSLRFNDIIKWDTVLFPFVLSHISNKAATVTSALGWFRGCCLQSPSPGYCGCLDWNAHTSHKNSNYSSPFLINKNMRLSPSLHFSFSLWCIASSKDFP